MMIEKSVVIMCPTVFTSCRAKSCTPYQKARAYALYKRNMYVHTWAPATGDLFHPNLVAFFKRPWYLRNSFSVAFKARTVRIVLSISSALLAASALVVLIASSSFESNIAVVATTKTIAGTIVAVTRVSFHCDVKATTNAETTVDIFWRDSPNLSARPDWMVLQ